MGHPHRRRRRSRGTPPPGRSTITLEPAAASSPVVPTLTLPSAGPSPPRGGRPALVVLKKAGFRILLLLCSTAIWSTLFLCELGLFKLMEYTTGVTIKIDELGALGPQSSVVSLLMGFAGAGVKLLTAFIFFWHAVMSVFSVASVSHGLEAAAEPVER